MSTQNGPPFVVIGENLHASRIVLRDGPRVTRLPDGSPALPFLDDDGVDRVLPVPAAALEGNADRQRVKHVKAAILAGLTGIGANLGAGYVRFLARRQVAAGAHYLDLNVDEVSQDTESRAAAMVWLVSVIEDATSKPLALDSSALDVLRRGLHAAKRTAGDPLLNSASLDRLDVLDLAATAGCPVILGGGGETAMPASADDRVSNGRRIVEEGTRRGLALDRLFLDPLVMPVAVDPEVGCHYLDAARSLRADFGPELHLTGGLSNVSFGLPARRLLNSVFIDLAADAGVDSGIIDPVANNPAAVFVQDRSNQAYHLAADVLTGRDPYAVEFLAAFRAGDLG
jgi:5-methyltetrahydrofolate--homocysteine methyltransferase